MTGRLRDGVMVSQPAYLGRRAFCVKVSDQVQHLFCAAPASAGEIDHEGHVGGGSLNNLDAGIAQKDRGRPDRVDCDGTPQPPQRHHLDIAGRGTSANRLQLWLNLRGRDEHAERLAEWPRRNDDYLRRRRRCSLASRQHPGTHRKHCPLGCRPRSCTDGRRGRGSLKKRIHGLSQHREPEHARRPVDPPHRPAERAQAEPPVALSGRAASPAVWEALQRRESTARRRPHCRGRGNVTNGIPNSKCSLLPWKLWSPESIGCRRASRSSHSHDPVLLDETF